MYQNKYTNTNAFLNKNIRQGFSLAAIEVSSLTFKKGIKSWFRELLLRKVIIPLIFYLKSTPSAFPSN